MSQVKINLQPPPNVDFVTGYPGIPPGSDRPQASVKGAIEVRVPQNGVKAKWVRIELRKIETLAGGGSANTFHDFVGPSPVNLWSTADDYTILRSQDFPFSIRIPESIPPTIALDNKAGITYELVATVCTKGKKGFLRKAKSVVVTTNATVIIDKHELHSTWPVYCQPEQRQIAQDGVTLIVDRTNTCYGPGDRVAVTATVKSDSMNTVILRGYEFFMREKTVFHAGIHATGKRNMAPQGKEINIAEMKVPVNATLHGGSRNTTELSFMISANHTTTTLSTARHIDITYTLCIRALLGSGATINMELPVIMSNWQRHVSYEAINRIGPAPSLSLLPPHTLPNRLEMTARRPSDIIAGTLPINRLNSDFNSGSAFHTLPTATSSIKPPSEDLSYRSVDDFGSVNKPVLSINPVSSIAPNPTPAISTIGTGRSQSATARFQVKNAEVRQESVSRNHSAQGTGSSAVQSQWPSAEEEKRRYEDARNNVAKVQGAASAPPPLAALRPASPPIATNASPPRNAAAASSSAPKQWLTAEEEKRRLFEKAQLAVQVKQAAQETQPVVATSTSQKLSGAALYQQAVGGRSVGGSSSNQSSAGNLYSGGSSKPPAVSSPGPQYLTAEQEKAALRRYHEAKRAVELSQNEEIPSSNPIAYDSLYPPPKATPTAASGSSSQPMNDAPPSFDAPAVGNNIISHLSEKERLRRAYEASDAAAQAVQRQAPPPAAYTAPPPVPAPTPAPVPTTSSPVQYANAMEEKEAMRRKFEARDAAKARNQAPQTPARGNSVLTTSGSPAQPVANSSPGRSPTNNSGSRPTPQPPVPAAASGGSRVLTAAEEKALLQAKFEARDGGRKPAPPPAKTNGAPPPLMPRPPVEYIQETQEEDARLSRLNVEPPNIDGSPKTNGAGGSSSIDGSPSGATLGLDMKPFTPFRAGFDTRSSTTAGLPPPLPNSGE